MRDAETVGRITIIGSMTTDRVVHMPIQLYFAILVGVENFTSRHVGGTNNFSLIGNPPPSCRRCCDPP
jgi:hypothetical protein